MFLYLPYLIWKNTYYRGDWNPANQFNRLEECLNYVYRAHSTDYEINSVQLDLLVPAGPQKNLTIIA